MSLKKNMLITSLLMVLVSSAIYGAFFLVFRHAIQGDETDIRRQAVDSWQCIQYYHEGKKIACTEDHPVSVVFEESSFSILGDEFPSMEAIPCTWGKHSMSFSWNEASVFALLYEDSEGSLRFVIHDWDYDFVLQRRIS